MLELVWRAISGRVAQVLLFGPGGVDDIRSRLCPLIFAERRAGGSLAFTI